jgi:hypothetical protein
MQKYVTLFLAILIVCLVAGGWWKQIQYLDELSNLNNALAASQQLIRETATAYSSKAFEVENLKTQNKDLQAAIKRNKEEIFALTNISLEWKDKYFEIKNAKQTVVDTSGSQPTSLSTECEFCLVDKRFKVEFNQEQSNLQISGYTLTNPPYASIKLHWTKPLKLQLALTKDKSGDFKVYIDSEDKEVVPTELVLKVDPTILGRKWIEKINIFGSIGVGHTVTEPKSWGGLMSVGVGYLITPRINLGLGVTALYNRDFQLYYQVLINYFPFAAAR